MRHIHHGKIEPYPERSQKLKLPPHAGDKNEKTGRFRKTENTSAINSNTQAQFPGTSAPEGARRQRATASQPPRSSPATGNSTKSALSRKAVVKSPCNSAWQARVAPQPGQFKPV